MEKHGAREKNQTQQGKMKIAQPGEMIVLNEARVEQGGIKGPEKVVEERRTMEFLHDSITEMEAEAEQKKMEHPMECDLKPKLGMEFDSVEIAWKFWVEYGGKKGFGVRKHYFNRNKKDGNITSYKFVCCKEGSRKSDKRDFLTINPRLETRTNCKARMGVTRENGRYKINELVEEHNHPLHLPETVHMLVSQRKLSEVQGYEIELGEDSGLQQKSCFDLMSRQVGGRSNLGYISLDVKNYIRTKRQRSMAYGEAGCLLQYFQRQLLENPSFFHACQMDVDEQITNVFWADARMLIDYSYFGDVISLDTTYSTNKAHRPLALFCGFNHFRGVVIFGAALMYDETVESFKWLFETFLEAHKQKKPHTIFTDQDQAMSKALNQVIPETFHGLCTWHLMQNAIKHLSNLMKDGFHILTDIKKCMYEYDEEVQFEAAWVNLLLKYSVQENTWLRSLYKIKEKWAACYTKKVLTLGMRSTQLSESLNSDFKSCMKPELDILQFFKNFERVVEDKRYNELKHEFESRHKIPRLKMENSIMLQQLAQIYTSTIFDLFQKEFDLYAAACIKSKNESQPFHEYIVVMVNREVEYRVQFDPINMSIYCSCKKFETHGILCCHALKVFDVRDVKILPTQYILKRWTKEARTSVVYDIKENKIEADPKLQSTQRYRQLCAKMIRLATEVSDDSETFLMVNKTIDDLSNQVMKLRLKDKRPEPDTTGCVTQAKGLKKKVGIKSKRRIKSWVEVQSKKKRRSSSSNVSQDRRSQGATQLQISSFTPLSLSTYTQLQRSDLNFTREASLDHPLQSLNHSMQSLDAIDLSGTL